MLKKRKTWSDVEKKVLWNRFKAGKAERTEDSELAFKELSEAYIPLVEILATRVASNLPRDTVEVDDLISDAFLGLLDAIRKFDDSRGFKFDTYASSRVTGHIYDKLRDRDWVSRYSRVKFKLLSKTTDLLFEEFQYDPSAEQIAERIGWSVDEVLKQQAAFLASFSWSLDEVLQAQESDFAFQEVTLADESIGEPGFPSEFDGLSDSLTRELFRLPEQESAVIYLHYYEMAPFSEIASMLGTTPSRVSQIYKAALKRLYESIVSQ